MSILCTGVDIVECLRIARMVERYGELFLERIFTSHEIEFCSARVAATQHYAGHWAAKEATLKAIQSGPRKGVAWKEIEIRYQPNGNPELLLRGGAKETMARSSIQKLHLSISHCRNFAVAQVIAEGSDL